MGIGSHGDKRASGRARGRGSKSAAAVALGICAALTAILAPIASANPVEEVAAGSQAALEEVVNTVVPPAATSPAVPPLPSPPVSTPQLPVKTPPVSAPPAPEAIPSSPKPQSAVKPPSPPSLPHALHGPKPDLGSSPGGKITSPEPRSSAAVTTPGSATSEKSSESQVDLGRDLGREVSPSPPTVSPAIAARRWFIHIWPAVSLGYVGRALIGRILDALGLGSPTAPGLTVGPPPPGSGFQPTALGQPHFGLLGEEEASERGEPLDAPSVGSLHSNPETVAFVLLAGLMALAVLAFGSEFSVFRRYRRW